MHKLRSLQVVLLSQMCSKAHGNQHESLNLKPTSCSNSSHGQGLLVSCEENLRGRGTYDTEHFICTRRYLVEPNFLNYELYSVLLLLLLFNFYCFLLLS